MTLDISTYWDIEGEPVAVVTTPTTWDINGKYILKNVKTENYAQNNVRFSTALRAEGIPVSSFIPLKAGGDYIIMQGGCYLLMEKLAGSHIRDVFQQDYEAIAFDVGVITAKIHNALTTMTHEKQINVPFDEELRGWIHKGLTASNLLTQDEWKKPIEVLLGIYPRLPQQQIHRDLHNGNLLFEGTRLTGVLDFDLGKQDARLFDIAYFLLGQLIKQNDLLATKDRWFIFIRRFLSGYESITLLEREEKEALPFMMQCIELLFIVFWERQANQEAAMESVEIFRILNEWNNPEE
jgi:Ser/Thr protein kinase RdoA (MazF antagonist)